MKRHVGILAAISTLVLNGCYVTIQGYHFLLDQALARPVDRLRVAATDEEERLFALVDAARTFAAEDLGLAVSQNYTRYRRTNKPYVVDVVSAAGELSFDRYYWWFPVVGRVPYTGYYRRTAALRAADRLQRRGQDVYVRQVEAFSALGFFSDLLYSFMTDYEEARLAELIIHESAHATLWLRDQAQFNEEFATFVGRAGARIFLIQRHGADSPPVRDFDAALNDQELYRRHILQLRRDLEDVYARSEEPPEQRRYAKERLIEEFKVRFADPAALGYSNERYRAVTRAAINNAYIDLFSTYAEDLSPFQAVLSAHAGDLRRAIAIIVQTAQQHPREPHAALQRALGSELWRQ